MGAFRAISAHTTLTGALPGVAAWSPAGSPTRRITPQGHGTTIAVEMSR
jgi:hypothetical protein